MLFMNCIKSKSVKYSTYPYSQVVSGRQQIHLASLEKSFTFDYAYGTATEQEEVYSSSVKVRHISQSLRLLYQKSTITF